VPPASERRTLRRLALALPIRIRVKARKTEEIESVTRDISAGGVYFTLSQTFDLGSELECQITLPPETPGQSAVQLRCRGKIVRVERPDEQHRIGVAASIEEYELTRLG
jgi:c-di-GMP-binding flagellar brake protein YcgR